MVVKKSFSRNNLPNLIWSQRQRAIKIDLLRIRSLVTKALPLCIAKPRHRESQLPQEIEITFLSERAIKKIHSDFLNDPTPTDVITFHHSEELGEILIGAPIAAKYAEQYEQPLEHEITRYIIHGMLHLLDYDDMTSEEYTLMHTCQEAILKAALKG